MNYKIRIKKLGTHWYPDIDHTDPYDLCLNEKIDKSLDLFDKNQFGQLDLYLWETYTVVDDNTIIFNDSDILRYLTTTDDFDLTFYVGDHEFSISSTLFNLIESVYNPNFHKSFYRIEISDRAI